MNVRGRVTVELQNEHISQSSTTAVATNHAFLPVGGTTTKATGSYIDKLLVQLLVFTTVGSCSVDLADGATGTTRVFPNVVAGTTTLMNTPFYLIEVGATSKNGPWRVVTGGNVVVTGVGRFNG